MARGALLTGTVGAIIGSITGFIGIVWSIVDIRYIWEIENSISQFISGYWFYLIPYSFLINPAAFIIGQIFSQTLTPSAGLFFNLSMLLALLILMSCILVGIGFFGMYQAGGGAMGVVGLAFGIIGGAAGSILLILGNVFTINYGGSFFGYFILTVRGPFYFYIFLGFAILGVSFILMGSSSIVVREATAHSSAAAAAGILSIIGGCCLFPYILNTFLISIVGGIFSLIAFVLLLSAFIIWIAVFYGSRNV